MIPGSFDYHRPSTVAEAVALLGSLGEDARPLAGGHSLIPVMKTRLSAPAHLVDLGGVPGLSAIAREGGEIVLGAMVTQHAIVQSDVLAEALPILRETALVIADPQIRYRGTLGGNVANGDPGNDMPAVMMCLGASYTLTGKAGSRKVKAADFYQGAYVTALGAGEFLTEIRIPVPPAGTGWAYEKLKRKIGDYATAAAAVMIGISGGLVTHCAIGLTNVAATPLLASDAAASLVGATMDKANVDRAIALAEKVTDPATDGRGTAEYRTKMAGVMLRRALARAAARAA